MKVIFLDIDGVLNGYGLLDYLFSLIPIKPIKRLYRRYTDITGIHEIKVKHLSKIIKSTNAKVVMSSSWRFSLWGIPYERLHGDKKKLTDLFTKYKIDVIDITPKISGADRDKEILQWLSKYESTVESFIILDDENTHLTAFHNDKRFIQTSSVKLGQMICGNWKERTGLRRCHVNKAIRLLNDDRD